MKHKAEKIKAERQGKRFLKGDRIVLQDGSRGRVVSPPAGKDTKVTVKVKSGGRLVTKQVPANTVRRDLSLTSGLVASGDRVKITGGKHRDTTGTVTGVGKKVTVKADSGKTLTVARDELSREAQESTEPTDPSQFEAGELIMAKWDTWKSWHQARIIGQRSNGKYRVQLLSKNTPEVRSWPPEFLRRADMSLLKKKPEKGGAVAEKGSQQPASKATLPSPSSRDAPKSPGRGSKR